MFRYDSIFAGIMPSWFYDIEEEERLDRFRAKLKFNKIVPREISVPKEQQYQQPKFFDDERTKLIFRMGCNEIPSHEELDASSVLSDLPIDVIKEKCNFDGLVRDVEAREQLKNATNEESALPAIEILCNASSKLHALTERDCDDFFEKGWFGVIEKIVMHSRELAPVIIRRCVFRNMPALAMKFFDEFNKHFVPDGRDDDLRYIEIILYKLKREAKSQRSEMLRTYRRVLQTFKGRFRQGDSTIEFLLKHHKKFRKGWDRGHFKHTLAL